MQFSLSSMTKNWSLKNGINHLEDAIITISGPALAISGIIAGLDLITGGTVLKDSPQLGMTWAICLLITLDFQVLAFGVRAHRIYRRNEKGWQSVARKGGELLLCLAIAGAISYVSIQMQSVIARTSADKNTTVAQAEQSLGIDGNALIWERSSLVLVLIFLSGWSRGSEEATREESGTVTITPAAAPAPVAPQIPAPVQPIIDLAQLTESVTENVVRRLEPQLAAMTALFERATIRPDSALDGQQALPEPGANVKKALPPGDTSCSGEHANTAGANEHEALANDAASCSGEQRTLAFASKEDAIAAYLADNPGATVEEIAAAIPCSKATASKWRDRLAAPTA